MKLKFGSVPSSVFRVDTPAIGALAALRRKNSFSMQMFGTSSGDESTEWFGLLGKKLAAANDYNCVWQLWSDTNSNYSVPSTIQAGSAGDRYVALNNSTNGSRFIYYAPAITGDIDVVAKIEPTAWAAGSTQTILAQVGATGNLYSWYFAISSTGKLTFKWYPDGTSTPSTTATDTVTRTETGPLWVRVTHDVDNGAAGNDVKFYTSTDGSTWTQSGATVTTAGTTNHFNSTAPFQAATFDTGGINPYIGKVYWVEIRRAIGSTTVVPALLELWDCTNPTSKPVAFGGSPTILLHNGSRAAQQLTYFYDAARSAQITEQCEPSVVFTNFNHNDSAMSTRTFLDRYKTMVALIKTAYPDAPIVLQSQSPMKDPKIASEIWADGVRGGFIGKYAAATAGLYYLDLWRSIDPTTMIGSDGIHPTARGSAAIANAYMDAFFGAAQGY